MRKIRYGKRSCRTCGRMITNNALGRASHQRSCKGRVGERIAAEERARKRESPLAMPTFGTDAFKTFVANAMAVEPHKRTPAQQRAVRVALAGETK